MRRLKVAAAVLVVLAVTLPLLPRTVLAALTAVLVVLAVLTRHWWRRRALVRHLHEAVAAVTFADSLDGLPRHPTRDELKRAGRAHRLHVKVFKWHKAEPVGPVRVRYPRSWRDGEPAKRAALERVIAAKLPGADWSASWDTRRDRVVFRRADPLPDVVAYADLAHLGGPRSLPIGVTHEDKTVMWRPDTFAHLLVAGRTRRGKSSLERVLLVTMIRRGWQVYAADPKSCDLAWLEGCRGVVEVTTTTDEGGIGPMVGTLRKAVDEMRDRYVQLRAAGVDKWQDLPPDRRAAPVAVVIDELYDLLAVSKDMTKRELADRDEAFSRLRALCAKGAGAGISVVMLTQQPYLKVLDGTLRENCEGRVLLGATRADQSRMVLDSDAGERIPSDAPKGRGIARFGGYADVQIAWLDRREITRWLPGQRAPRTSPADQLGEADVVELRPA